MAFADLGVLESPTAQVISALEESATEIHGSSCDIRRAFD